MYVDEKAQLYYINDTLPTFAFEIDSYQKGVLVDGWLLNDNLLTTHYNLIYPNARHTDLNCITKDDFTRVDIVCIPKSSLRVWLEQQGMTREYLKDVSRRARGNGSQDKYREASPCTDAWFIKSASFQYSETPLNLVIRKKVLVSLAMLTATVTQTDMTISFPRHNI